MITHQLDLCPTLPMCKIFPFQRGTVSAPCTKFNNFSNHILLPSQSGGGGGEEAVFKVKGSKMGAREKPLQNGIYNICSVAEFAPEKAKVFKSYYFKIL